MKIKRLLIAATAVAFLTAGAMADLTGTDFNALLTNTGFVGNALGPSGGAHDWGTTDTFSIGALNWKLTSPAVHPNYDNAMKLDFTSFQYFALTALGPSQSVLSVLGLDENVAPGSVAVFLPSNLNSSIAMLTSDSGSGFTAMWDVGAVVASDPVHPGVVVAWNSVPTPGALALLGLAGLTGGSRRRRRA